MLRADYYAFVPPYVLRWLVIVKLRTWIFRAEWCAICQRLWFQTAFFDFDARKFAVKVNSGAINLAEVV